MKLSDYLVDELNKNGVDKVFGYIGGMIAHIVDSIYLNDNIEMINTITEQGAGFAAEAYARINNKLGVAIATSGPGATNLITPIANSFFDSTPVLFITGQVNSFEYKKYNLKQCGFQETDIVNIVKPIVKYAKLIKNPQDIKYELHKAIHIALSGRKGPVLLDIPMNIQKAKISPDSLKSFIGKNEKFSELRFNETIIEKAKKPLILVGNGVNLSGANKVLKDFLDKYKIPVVESMHGIDAVENNYEYNLGLIGTYGDRYGNLAFYDSDLLIVLGARLDIRQTGSDIEFLKNKKIIQVDIDNRELECPKFNKMKIKADIKNFLLYLISKNISIDCKDWLNTCKNLKVEFSHEKKIYSKPNVILNQIFNELKENDKITFDVGQNQIWAAQSLKIKSGQRAITSGGLGSMGFALPSAIGASINGDKTVVITGDGGMQMNIQELEVIKRRNLPVKIIVMNNSNLAMVRQFQELYFDGRVPSTVKDYSSPDFTKIAQSYGINAITIKSNKFDINLIKDFLNDNKPILINILFEKETITEPRVEFGNSISNPNPKIDETIISKILNKNHE